MDTKVISNGGKNCKQILNLVNDMHVEVFKEKCTDVYKLLWNSSKIKQEDWIDG